MTLGSTRLPELRMELIGVPLSEVMHEQYLTRGIPEITSRLSF